MKWSVLTAETAVSIFGVLQGLAEHAKEKAIEASVWGQREQYMLECGMRLYPSARTTCDREDLEGSDWVHVAK